jgi:uncharacterized protein YbaP (TraB family)
MLKSVALKLRKHAVLVAGMQTLVLLILGGSITISIPAQTAATASAEGAKPGTSADAAQPAPKPALWRLKGTHGTMYLFGTRHNVQKGVAWETETIKKALKDSSTVYLPVAGLDEETRTEMKKVRITLGVDAEHPLSSKISKEDLEMLDAAAKQLGAPGESIMEHVQPWVAWLYIESLPEKKAGTDAGLVVNGALDDEAQDAGKAVKGLTTADAEIRSIAELPLDLQIQLLHASLVDIDTEAARIQAIQEAWLAGDVEAMISKGIDDMKAKVPAVYEALNVKEDKRYAAKLMGFLKDPQLGTIFVALPASDVIGPDGVLSLLEKHGVAAERVE